MEKKSCESWVNDINYPAHHMTYYICETSVSSLGRPPLCIFNRSGEKNGLRVEAVWWVNENRKLNLLSQPRTCKVLYRLHVM